MPRLRSSDKQSTRLRAPRLPSGLDQYLGDDETRNTPCARRASGTPGEDETSATNLPASGSKPCATSGWVCSKLATLESPARSTDPVQHETDVLQRRHVLTDTRTFHTEQELPKRGPTSSVAEPTGWRLWAPYKHGLRSRASGLCCSWHSGADGEFVVAGQGTMTSRLTTSVTPGASQAVSVASSMAVQEPALPSR